MMAGTETLNYFLCPHMTLSEDDLRVLGIFLPRVKVLEIVRRASIPQWALERVSGWPVLRGNDLAARINSCLQGYRNFAQVHGGPGGILGFLSAVFDEIEEPRYRIQEELRGKCPPEMDPVQKETIQAALFLEIAREFDEKELEIESGYAHLSAIEQEFRDIVGIEDEDSESAEAHLAPALAHDPNGLLYMLPRRIASWFRLFSLQPVEGLPVFVGCLPEVIEETLEMIRVGCERNGKGFSTATYLLGSIPEAGKLGQKQLQTLIEAPGMPELLSSCHRELEDVIKGAAGGGNQAELEGRSRSLQSDLEKLCGKCTVAEGDRVNLGLTLVENVSFADVAGFLGGSDVKTAAWPPVFLSIRKGD
jgi:hypothetical protein